MGASGQQQDDAKLKDNDVVIFQMVVDHFKQDTREFWTRANFFLVAHAGLFSAYFVTYQETRADAVSIMLPLLGLLIAAIWLWVMRGAVFFLQKWREQVIKLDSQLDRFHCYVEVESTVVKRPYLSPSFITQFLPIIFGLVWLILLAFELIS